MELSKLQEQKLHDLLEDIANDEYDMRNHLEVIASKLTPSEVLIAERAAIECAALADTPARAWKRGLEFALVARMVKNAAIKARDEQIAAAIKAREEKIAVREALDRGEG